MVPSTFAAAVAVAAAAFFTRNVARNLALVMLGSGAAVLAFLVALLVAFFFMLVAPGLRPAPGRRPPEQPGLPTMSGRRAARGARKNPKKADPQMTCTKNGTWPIRCAFENGA